jgi:hypothetical protein
MLDYEDWLYGIPPFGPDGFAGQIRAIRTRIEANPAAAAVSDEEAALFFGAAWVLASSPSTADYIARKFEISANLRTRRGRQGVILESLHMWRNEDGRRWLILIQEGVQTKGIGDAMTCGDRISLYMLQQAYKQGLCIMWIVRILQMTGRAGEIPDFLAYLGAHAKEEYRLLLDAGRLMLRRIVYGDPDSGVEAAPRPEQRQKALSRRLQGHDRELKALQADLRQAQEKRRQWQREAQAAEADARSLADRAAEEVAAAEAVQELSARQQRELEEAEARHQARVHDMQLQLARVRSEFAEALAQRGATSGVAPLRGLTVAVEGDEANREGYRALVESAGGRLTATGGADLRVAMGAKSSAPDSPGVFRTEEAGLAAFERVLRWRILPTLRQRVLGGKPMHK